MDKTWSSRSSSLRTFPTQVALEPPLDLLKRRILRLFWRCPLVFGEGWVGPSKRPIGCTWERFCPSRSHAKNCLLRSAKRSRTPDVRASGGSLRLTACSKTRNNGTGNERSNSIGYRYHPGAGMEQFAGRQH